MNESSPPGSSIILKTKLYPPLITPDMVPRLDLLERLEQNRQRPLTLISAPAGYGKSILASMWLEASDLPGGWLSLDDSDNNLYTFVSYFLAAIETAVPQASFETNTLLSDSVSAPAGTLARRLLAELDQLETPILLIIDDIHHIHDQNIFNFLEALLSHPSPHLHLVLVGRQDPPLPIASWRAYDQITEIRMRDLRFTSPETALFLSKNLRRDVSESLAVEWTDKTEGWIVALRLAAISLRYSPQPGKMEALMPGDNQFLQDYLMAEVLAQLPASLKSCLLATSLLNRFCAPLCEAVCSELRNNGQLKVNGEQYIEWLQQSNLFLINLDQQKVWFRFHHLFQEDLQQVLQKQFSQQEIATLHLKASQWYAENGWVREAIEHALVAHEPNAALAVFTKNRIAAMNGERWHQLEQWVRLFPEDVVQNDPVLLLTRAHLPLAYGIDYEALLARAGSVLASIPADSAAIQNLWAEMSYFSGLAALMMGPAAAVNDAGAKMKESLPADAYYLLGQALGLEAIGHQMAGNIRQGAQLLQEALSAGNLPVNLQSKACLYQTQLYFMEADLATAQIFAEKNIELASKHNLDASEARCFAGMAYYLQNDLAQAETLLLPIIEHPAWVNPMLVARSACVLMSLYHALGKPDKAGAIMQQTRSQLEEQDNAFSLQLFDMYQAELALERGYIAHARQLILPLNVSLQLPIWFWQYFTPQLTPIKLWLAEGEEVDRALALLIEMDEFLRKINRNIHRIDILALQALAHKSLNNWPKALEKLAQSVALAARGKLIRNYLNLGPQIRELLAQLYRQSDLDDRIDGPTIARILEAFSVENAEDGQGPSPAAVPVDPLTNREREVLMFLATDLTTREIAEEMSVSWSTIRTHIKNIYSKLGVHGRYEAVLYAKEQELL